MKLNLIGPFKVNYPFGTEIAFSKGLKKIGCEVVEIDPNIDKNLDALEEADATIVFKSCVGGEENLDRIGGLKIVYQPDDARFPHIKKMMLEMRSYCDHFLSFDDYGAELAKQMRYETAEVLLLTADDELYCPSPAAVERDIDVSFIGSLGDPVAHASRRKMIQFVKEKSEIYGWKTAFGTTQSIPQVLDIYRRSKVVLNHATDVGQPFGWGYGYQCRHFEVGMTATGILSNSVYGGLTHDLRPKYANFEDEAEMLDKIDAISRFYLTVGEQTYEEIKKRHLPEHRAYQIVDYIERISQ